METMIFFAQTCLVAFLAAWLTTGVRDNLLYPATNGAVIGAVLKLERLKALYPEDFELIAHRRIENSGLHRSVFGFIIFCEAVACLALWISVALMAGALMGVAEAELAKTAALASVLGFTSIWAGFLVAGNHFAYWMCHEWAQATHFKMLLWGLGTMIFLAVG